MITNAEEIAFYNGAELEHSILNKTYMKLIKHINSIYKIRISYNMFEDFLIKYAWGAFGLIMCAIPVFTPHLVGSSIAAGALPAALPDVVTTVMVGEKPSDEDTEGAKIGARTKGFITNKRLMMSLADAGGRMMYSYKELAELAGYTSRVYNLLSVLHALHDNKFDGPKEKKAYTLTNINGKIVFDGDNGITFENVPIVTPAPGQDRVGEVLVNNLNVQVRPGEHLLVTGPNGVGKTAVARVIASLWPVFGKVIECVYIKRFSNFYLCRGYIDETFRP